MNRNPAPHHYDRMALIDRIIVTPGLSAGDRLVGILLAQRMRTRGREAGKTWMKREDLATTIGVSGRAITTATANLEQAGLLRTWRMRYGNLYRFNAAWNDVPSMAAYPRTLIRS